MGAEGVAHAGVSNADRWWQRALGVGCVVIVVNLQYGWTLFVNPMDDKYHWGRAIIQVAFAIFMLIGTLLVPTEPCA
jgi:MFS transporter, OFA family, oxalate/formate antiporter